ncbi:hypothetical protein ASE95_03120 [Sphingomonas sp. Leaf231]|uniref:hypothetical protein n=1 Tax=Sphingomonas sp. Leaf231 TaxID=1736301 RepID=UPI0006FE5999|nr:hypothetical protein [Sphingomonas sp. Leaf231]KQN93904.1 hypothetical protein ASE95_03120 [Sphingomonas sp. Leaf231]
MLDAALSQVAAAWRFARDPWWVIGSAAVWLHGVATTVADIDVLASARDAEAMIAAWPGAVTTGAAGARFRSHPFARLDGAALPVEVMADLEVRVDRRWQSVRPLTRVACRGVFVPDRAELATILRRFGRAKDLGRAAALDRRPG